MKIKGVGWILAVSGAGVIVGGGCASGPGGAGPGDAEAALVAETDAWHADRIDRLTAPDGWLTLVALEWLEEGRNSVGSSVDAGVRYAGFPRGEIGAIWLGGGVVRFEAAEGMEVAGVPADGVLASDADGAPTVLSVGDIRFYVVIRGGQPAVRIKDAAAETRTGFAGIERYPASERWRVRAAFSPAALGTTKSVDTVIGVREEVPVVGRATFDLGGETLRPVIVGEPEGTWYLRFGDKTNGAGTYPVGRYVTVERTDEAGEVVIDFNRAYNPPCAFTDFATCTIPTGENDFEIAVTAGEKWSGGH